MSTRFEVEITDQPSARRYEMRVEGELAGLLEYRADSEDGPVRFTHAEVYPRYDKQGLGTRMVAHAVADVVGQHRKFVPECPFVAYFVDNHPEYSEHVA